MLTVKAEFNEEALKHVVHQCDRYSVYHINTPDATGVTQLLMYKGGQCERGEELLLHTGTRAYVMNEYGATVDTIYGTSLQNEQLPF